MYGQFIHFILLCEGNSDRALVPHLERLLVLLGASSAIGSAIPLASVRGSGERPGTMLERKMVAVLSAEHELDLLFVHRDADAVGHEVRTSEISKATNGADLEVSHVPIVPVRTTEAWVLQDEGAIRRVAGNPRGREPLNLPRPARVEELPDPKETLENALVAASGFRGSRLRKFRRRFGQQRRILLEQLPVGGALEQVPAWRRLKDSVSELVAPNENP